MRKLWSLIVLGALITLISGCGENNREKAIAYLLGTPREIDEISVVVFNDRKLEDSFVRDLQTNIDYINNHIRIKDPIMNVNLINVKEYNPYKYENIFDLKTYPSIILFQNEELLAQFHQPKEILEYVQNEKDK